MKTLKRCESCGGTGMNGQRMGNVFIDFECESCNGDGCVEVAVDIVNRIPHYPDTITRGGLCAATGLPDRQVRRLIHDARMQGHPIINLQDGRGYYLATDAPTIRQQIALNTSRIAALVALNVKLQKHVREIEGQEVIDA